MYPQQQSHDLWGSIDESIRRMTRNAKILIAARHQEENAPVWHCKIARVREHASQLPSEGKGRKG